MAKKKPKKKKASVYDPTAPSFRNSAQLEKRANSLAQSKLAPSQNSLNNTYRGEAAKNVTNQANNGNWYGWVDSRLQDSFDKTNSALNNLITTQSGGSEAAQANLAASLSGQQDKQNALSQIIGGSAGPGNSQAVLNASAAAGAMNRDALGAQSRGLTVGAGERLSTGAIAHREAQEGEKSRYDQILAQLRSQREDLNNQLPGLVDEARQTLQDNELKKQSQKFQQGLASDQLNLQATDTYADNQFQEDQLTSSNQQSAETNKLNWAQLGYTQAQDNAKLQGEQYQNAYSLLDSYKQGIDAKNAAAQKAGKPNVVRPGGLFNDAFRLLTSRSGLTRRQALQLLQTSDDVAWRKKAKYLLIPKKKRKVDNKKLQTSVKNVGKIFDKKLTAPTKKSPKKKK